MKRRILLPFSVFTFLFILSCTCGLPTTLTSLGTATTPPRAVPTTTPSTRAATLAPAAAEFAVPTEDPLHVQPNQQATYKTYPPSSGKHYGQYLDWGVYTKDVPPEYWVHGLEHGGIVILYNCALLGDCTKAQKTMETLFKAAPPDPEFKRVKILISPNSKITSPVVALAWGWQLNLNDINQTALIAFYQKYVNQGPELVP